MGKEYYNSFSIGSNFFLYRFKNKIVFNVVKVLKFVASKQGQTADFSPSSFVVAVGSGMNENQDPGSGINIPDSKHCLKLFRVYDQIKFCYLYVLFF